jgi:hypothetical protein
MATTQPTQPTTRAGKALELSLMLKNILDQADDDPIPLALAKKKVNYINDLVDLEPTDFHALVYDEADGVEAEDGVTPKYKPEEIPCGSRALLKIFKTFVHYESEVNGLKLRDDWSKLDRDRFNDYRFTQECTYRVMQLSNPNAPTTIGPRGTVGSSAQFVTSQATKSMSADPHDVIRRDWKRGMKRDPSAFPTFTNDKAWENWHHGFVITFNVQEMMSNILDSD